jgi:hypothetical protein
VISDEAIDQNLIDYDGRKFRKPGDDGGTVAVYHQDGDVVWAEFTGGPVRRGSLNGTRRPDGTLHLGYTIVLDTGDVVCGRTVNTPELVPDGRIRLHERWERYGPHADSGTSYVEEVD